MARTAVLALLLLALMAGEAQATHFQVVAVPGQSLDILSRWEGEGAVGLLVPGAGPETSEALARISLERGAVRNSLRGGIPQGERLIEVLEGPIPGHPVVVVGLPEGGRQPNDRRYPVVVIGRGASGKLVSPTTRIEGLVSIADIAPTALGRTGSLSWEPADDAAAALLALDGRIDQNNGTRTAATFLVSALLAALAFLWPRAALLGFAGLLGANLLLGMSGTSLPWLVLAALGLSVILGGPLLALILQRPLGIGLALAGVLVAYLVLLGLDGDSVALSPLGPTQNSRFYGLSNLLETLLLVPALAGAALLSLRLRWAGFAVIAAVSLLAVAGNRFGADGGGAIVLAAGFAVLVILLTGARVKAALAALLVAGLGVLGLLALDAATGGSSHVSRALEGGPVGLAGDLKDRIVLSWERTTEHWYVAVLVGAGIAVLAALVVRLFRRALPLPRRALPLAFAAALATSLLVNDSPNDVVVTGLAGYLTIEAVMLRDRCAALFSSSPLRFSWPAAAARRPSRPSPRA